MDGVSWMLQTMHLCRVRNAAAGGGDGPRSTSTKKCCLVFSTASHTLSVPPLIFLNIFPLQSELFLKICSTVGGSCRVKLFVGTALLREACGGVTFS